MGLTLPQPQFWRERRVLLTGHTGFKGSWLTLWLQRLGAVVHGYSLDTSPLWDGLSLAESFGVRHQLGDVRHPEDLACAVDRCQPQVVFHLAAQPLVREAYHDPQGTWSTNVLGTLQLLEALRRINHLCAVVLITTDKVYANQEWEWGYRESDALGGHDPYSASKAAMELLVASWRSSFCGVGKHQVPNLALATARAGNVIGGGDWAAERIVPDAMRAIPQGKSVTLRNPNATRPWQHVLEPLCGYLLLAEALSRNPQLYSQAYNFGPAAASNRSVKELVGELYLHWPLNGGWRDASERNAPHEATRLHLVSDRAEQQLGWKQRWDFNTTAARTAGWYRGVHQGKTPLACCLDDLHAYTDISDGR